jgi:hypothetical protein
MIDNKLKQKIFIETYNSLLKLPKDKRLDKRIINRLVAENYVKYCEVGENPFFYYGSKLVHTNNIMGSVLSMYGIMSKGAKWLWNKIKGDPQLDQRTKAIIAQKMAASAKNKLATKDVITKDELLQIMQDSFEEKTQSKVSEVTDPHILQSFIDSLMEPLKVSTEKPERPNNIIDSLLLPKKKQKKKGLF